LMRLRSAAARAILGGCLLLVMFAVDLRYMQRLDLNDNRGASGIVDYIEAYRKPNEPVVVCSQLYYLPLRYHASQSRGAAGWFQYAEHDDTSGLDAWTAMGAVNVLGSGQLQLLSGRNVWIVEGTDESLDLRPVPVPSTWVEVQRMTYPDTYGLKTDWVVIKYNTGPERTIPDPAVPYNKGSAAPTRAP
jgi:hypothetical protein